MRCDCRSPSAVGAPEAVDLELNIGASDRFEGHAVLTENGGTATVTRKNFVVHAEVDLITAAWEATQRSNSSSVRDCAGEPTIPMQRTAVEHADDGALQVAGRSATGDGESSLGYYYDIIATQSGSFAYSAEIVDTADVDPVLSNNRSAITIVVNETSRGGGGGSGGGGSGGGGSAGGGASVRAGSVKLSPVKPRAGSTVVASVRVTKGGSAVRPVGVSCVASIGKATTKGAPTSKSGVASCRFKTPRSAKGKSLTGSISFRAGGSPFSRQFVARLG